MPFVALEFQNLLNNHNTREFREIKLHSHKLPSLLCLEDSQESRRHNNGKLFGQRLA